MYSDDHASICVHSVYNLLITAPLAIPGLPLTKLTTIPNISPLSSVIVNREELKSCYWHKLVFMLDFFSCFVLVGCL